MAKWWECSRVYGLRCRVEKRLKLPAAKVEDETATQFWERVECAGLLVEALALYDKLDAEYEAWKHTARDQKRRSRSESSGKGDRPRRSACGRN